MSFYATMAGRIIYPSKETYNEVVKELTTGGWLNAVGNFIDTSGNEINEDSTDTCPDTCTVRIPYFYYRNLNRVNFFVAGATGWLVGTSTDGCFHGWRIRGCGEKTWDEQNFDLNKWAKEHNFKPAPDADKEFDAYCAWQSDVEQAFFDVYADL